MLTIQQLAKLKSSDPYLYESLRQTVAAADGIFDLAITDNSPVHRGIFYFAESDTSSSFIAPRVHFLGCSRNARVALGNVTLYWRAYSQYLGSLPSPPVTFGSPPAAVTGGGSNGPALA